MQIRRQTPWRHALAGALLLVVGTVTPANAEIFRYVDEEGNTHYVESINKVPEQYRDQVRSISGQKMPSYQGRPPATDSSGASGSAPPAVRGIIGDNDGNTQAYWCTERERISQELEQVSSRLEVLESRGAVNVDQAAGLKALYEIQQEIAELKEKKATLQDELDDLPNRVRKAGGNPGWVRGVTCPTSGPTSVKSDPNGGPSPEELKSREYWEGLKKQLETNREKIKQSIARAQSEVTGNAGGEYDPVVAAQNKMLNEDLARLQGELARVERDLADLPNRAAAAGVPRSWVE